MVVDKLSQLVASKQAMLHMMSHELMTPLMGIVAMSSNMIRSKAKAGTAQVRWGAGPVCDRWPLFCRAVWACGACGGAADVRSGRAGT